MQYFEPVLFLNILVIAYIFIRKRVVFILRNIRLGKVMPVITNHRQRLKNMMLVAFGQRKMFQNLIPALLHFCVYLGFIIINFEVLEFIIDGIFGSHRFFAPYLGSLYNVLLNGFEFLAVAVLLACLVFLWRRNIIRVPRFWSKEMTPWPRLDANLILLIEIVLMIAILTMNASDQVLQTRSEMYPSTGKLLVSSQAIPLFSTLNTKSLIIIERLSWWFHILGILGFTVYITYSKHLHIFLAFPTTYLAKLTPHGKILTMPFVTQEVKTMLGMENENPEVQEAPKRFGAKDIDDLSRVNLLAAYSCTECGRCTAECPANLTGKKLSPRKVMMDVRDRLEVVGNSLSKGGPGLNDGKSLLGDYISKEEINACTSCQACVEACPIMINPLDIILELRRYVTMEESKAPETWNAMFQNIETNFSPWKFPINDRFNWFNN